MRISPLAVAELPVRSDASVVVPAALDVDEETYGHEPTM
jgi:hypothetical protein